MNDPYEILGVDNQADEPAIRQRYLELVRQNPPEREPERFAAIRDAYDQLRDPAKRMHSRLFGLGHDSLDAIKSELLKRMRAARISTDTLLSLTEST